MKGKLALISPGTWTLVALALAILAWEAGAAAGAVDVFFFGSPSLVWAEFCEMVEKGSMGIRQVRLASADAAGQVPSSFCSWKLWTVKGTRWTTTTSWLRAVYVLAWVVVDAAWVVVVMLWS